MIFKTFLYVRHYLPIYTITCTLPFINKVLKTQLACNRFSMPLQNITKCFPATFSCLETSVHMYETGRVPGVLEDHWEYGSWSCIDEEPQGYRFFELPLGLPPVPPILKFKDYTIKGWWIPEKRLSFKETKWTGSQWQNQTGSGNPTALLHVKRKWRFWGTSWQCINDFLMEAFKEYLSASDYFHIISLKNKQECFINIKTQGTADQVTKTG